MERRDERETAEDESKIAAEEGASENTPLLWRAGTVTSTDYTGDIQFRNNVHGVEQLRDWAGRAETEARAGMGKKNGGATESLESRIDRWDADPTAGALDVIFRIWEEVLQRELNTGAVTTEGVTKEGGIAYGQILEFSLACLAAVGITEGRGKPLAQASIRGRIRRHLPIYRKEQASIKRQLATYECVPTKT